MTLTLITAVVLGGLAGGGDLVCPRPIWDFGTRGQSETFAGFFVLENHSSSPVTITGVTARCSCAHGRVESTVVPPAGETKLHFRFETRQFEGRIRKELVVRYRGRKAGSLTVSITGEVVPPWTLSTSTLQLGAVRPGEVARGEFVVSAAANPKVVIRCASPSPEVAVDTSKHGGRWTVTVRVAVARDARPGPIYRVVDVSSDDPRKPSARVLVVAYVEGDLSVRPRVVNFGTVAAGKAARRSVVIESRSGRPFELVEFRSAGEVLFCGRLHRSAVRHEFDLELQAGLPPGNLQGRVSFLTRGAVETSIVIGFRARISEP